VKNFKLLYLIAIALIVASCGDGKVTSLSKINVWDYTREGVIEDCNFCQSTLSHLKNQLRSVKIANSMNSSLGSMASLGLSVEIQEIEQIIDDCKRFANEDNTDRQHTMIEALNTTLDTVKLYNGDMLKTAEKLRTNYYKVGNSYKYAEPVLQSSEKLKEVYTMIELTSGVIWIIEFNLIDGTIYWDVTPNDNSREHYLLKELGVKR